MNLKKVIFLLIAVIITQCFMAQSNLLNASLPDEVGLKTADQVVRDHNIPISYGYVDDRDILWSKMVWEYIDLNEKINLPYYYPIDTYNIDSKRRSLFDTLLNGIKDKTITEVYEGDSFEHKLSLERINKMLIKIDTTNIGIDKANFGEKLDPGDVNITELNSIHIEGFKIKGLYYFDKRQGEIKYRLLGIAPIAPDINQLAKFGDDIELEEMVPLFWIWYPDARTITHDMIVFNHKNSAFPLTYDLLLNARRFSAIIYKEENMYGNREVASYIRGNSLIQVLESNNIKNKIRDFDLDMWNY